MIAASQVMPQLLIQTETSNEQYELPPGSEWTLGRHPGNTIQLSDRCASRQHAKLVSLQNHHYCYVDLNSRNGSKIKGQSITTPILLQHDDRIKIGDTQLVFQDTPEHRATGASTNAQVLLLQASTLQGKIWQSILRSQNIDSFWESAKIDLKAYLPQRVAAAALPKLLVLDTQLWGAQTYDLCNWCRQTFPQMQIIINDSQERQILVPERQKATQAGCVNWFPAFREPKLLDNVAGIVVQVNSIMKTLDKSNLRQDKLFTALKSLEQLIAEVSNLNPPAKTVEKVSPSQQLDSAHLIDSTQISRKRQR